jgi:Uma2 family endonuclease
MEVLQMELTEMTTTGPVSPLRPLDHDDVEGRGFDPRDADAFDPVEYPDSDGLPMAEADRHRQDLTYLVEALSEHFRHHRDVYVSGNLLLYYERGNPKKCVAPDLFVVFGVSDHPRRNYLLWREGRAPSMVVEVTSRSTRRQDLEEKKALYARLGVEEYYLFDPEGEYLEPRLQGYRLSPRGRRYRKQRSTADGSLRCRTLGLTLGIEGDQLRLSRTATGEKLLRYAEASAQARSAEAARQSAEKELLFHAGRVLRSMTHNLEMETRAEQAIVERQRAEERARAELTARRWAEEHARNQALRAEQEAARAEQEAARAEQEAARAEQEAARAEQEAAARRALEEEIERLRQGLSS